jgi:uncharacterized protein involved in type VI secretion and phage assembly
MNDSNIETLVMELTELLRSRYFGKYRALVKDVNDPDTCGRITVTLKEIYGENDSPWALPSFPFGGNRHGLIMLPEIGDGVWIEFEGGDPSRPVWTGAWLADGEMPDPVDEKVRAIVTSRNHKIIIDDNTDELRLVHGGGAEIVMTNDDLTLRIGNTQIVLSSQGVDINNGALTVSP